MLERAFLALLFFLEFSLFLIFIKFCTRINQLCCRLNPFFMFSSLQINSVYFKLTFNVSIPVNLFINITAHTSDINNYSKNQSFISKRLVLEKKTSNKAFL